MDGNRTARATWIVALAACALAGCRGTGETDAPADSNAPVTTVTAPKSGTSRASAADEKLADDAARDRARAMARYTQGKEPVYPEMSRRLGEEGTVELKIGLLHDGSVHDLAIGRSSGHPRLDAAALAAARTWRFNPRTGGGEVETIVYRVVFELQDGE